MERMSSVASHRLRSSGAVDDVGGPTIAGDLSHHVRMKEPDTRMLGAPVVPHDEASLMCVAAEQSGLLTRAQCLAAGMTDPAIRWRLSRGHWIAVHAWRLPHACGVGTTGAPAPSPRQLAVDGSAWSHRSAAFVHGLNAVPPEHIDLVIDARHRIAATTWGRAASTSGRR